MRTFPWLFAALLLSSVASAADVELFHQGRLLDSSGAPVSGDQQFSFTLYGQAIGGTPNWSETQSITVTNGVYSVSLGAVTPLSDTVFDADLWLDIDLVGHDFDSPRQFLHAVPYAVRASRVVGSVTLTPSDEDCDANGVGALQFDTDSMTVQFCDGNGWLPLGGDGIPDSFSIPGSGAAPGALATSTEVALTGYDVPVRVTLSGDGSPQVSIDRGPWSNSGTLPVAGSLEVRALTPSVSGQSNTIQVIAGGQSADWVATAGDVVPEPFTVPDAVALASDLATSSGVQLSGYKYPISVSISGAGNPQISVDGAPWGTSATLPVGGTLQARATAPASNGQSNTSTITAGGVTSSWSARAGYNEQYLRTVDTPVGVMTFTFAAHSSQSCDAACSTRGLSCNGAQLTAIHQYAIDTPGYTMDLYQQDFDLTFQSGANVEQRMSMSEGYIGLGCGGGTFAFNGFGQQVTGCNQTDVAFTVNVTMSCSGSGYNNGNFSGPRLCPCN